LELITLKLGYHETCIPIAIIFNILDYIVVNVYGLFSEYSSSFEYSSF